MAAFERAVEREWGLGNTPYTVGTFLGLAPAPEAADRARRNGAGLPPPGTGRGARAGRATGAGPYVKRAAPPRPAGPLDRLRERQRAASTISGPPPPAGLRRALPSAYYATDLDRLAAVWRLDLTGTDLPVRP